VSSAGRNSLPYTKGCTLQRLFSTFPDSWPGLGLLSLRVGLSGHLIFMCISDLSARSSEPITLTTCLAAALGGIFLLAGLWTPIMGALVALDEVWIAFLLHSSGLERMSTHICLAVMSTSVAMLGPGAWSVDARLYGRRRLYSDRHRSDRPPS
jgi:putative oxidoreductase